MNNFSIFIQLEKELKDFYNTKIPLSQHGKDKQDSVRYARSNKSGNMYSQYETINLIDLYDSSKFEDGNKDKLGQTKIFLNVGSFRRDVAAKQIDIDVKDFKFIPEDGDNKFIPIVLQKEFRQWAKDQDFAKDINTFVEAFPTYGTIVGKECGNEIEFVPLQNLVNEQTAESLEDAAYVIETHPKMGYHELAEMADEGGWNIDDLNLKYGETADIYERYGYVPRGFILEQNGKKATKEDWNTQVDSMAILAPNAKDKSGNAKNIVLMVEEITERPYREAHYARKHGRWLGEGEIEKQFPNQIAKNIIVNLLRRSLHWSSKRLFETTANELSAKNLIRDVSDGEVLEVGQNGQIRTIDTSMKGGTEFSLFLQEFEKNSDAKAFTYESMLMNQGGARTAFRLGALLTSSAQAYFDLKHEKLGLFFKEIIEDFQIPKFLAQKDVTKRVLKLMSNEEGFMVMKDAVKAYHLDKMIGESLLSGKPVDASMIQQVEGVFKTVNEILLNLKKNNYKELEYKFVLDITGEDVDIKAKLTTLGNLYQLLAQKGDPRAEKVLEKIAELSGEDMEQFGAPEQPQQPNPAPQNPIPGDNQPSLQKNGGVMPTLNARPKTTV